MTKGWPHNSPDEFGPYLTEQLRDPDVRAAYETEQTNDRAVEQINAFQAERGGEQVTA